MSVLAQVQNMFYKLKICFILNHRHSVISMTVFQYRTPWCKLAFIHIVFYVYFKGKVDDKSIQKCGHFQDEWF